MRIRLLTATLVLMGLAADSTWGQGEPARVDYEEQVEVRLIQIEVTVWPKNGDAASCSGLTKDDFELSVRGKPREIEAADWIGSPALGLVSEETPAAEPGHVPLSIVLYFDLWHLDLFYRPFPACPRTKPIAFDEARRMVREQFRRGDRLLLVTFMGWPQVHYGWIEDPSEALAAIDRLEVSPFVLSPRQTHSSEYAWIDGMNNLLLALGNYKGSKQLIYLGDDFRFEQIETRLFELAARAQANQVTLNAVDLLSSCRSTPGIECDSQAGGPGCTRWRTPVALGPMSRNTGGNLFRTEAVATAVSRIREMSGCRYVISFPSTARDGKRRNRRTRVRVEKPGFTLHAPISFQNPEDAPKEREELDALFLLPKFGKGLIAEVGLWPLRPTGRKGRWNALLLARLRRSVEPWPDEMEQLLVEAVVQRSSKVHAAFSKQVTHDELRQLRDSGEPRLFVFPVEDVRPGEATVTLRASGGDGEVAANVRVSTVVPEPPRDGEARPWFLVDRLARAGERLTILPALEGILASETPALVIGYGCAARGAPAGGFHGRVAALKDESARPVSIDWLDAEASRPDGCGWLAGDIDGGLAPGLWRFEPPAALTAEDEDLSILFRVAGRTR